MLECRNENDGWMGWMCTVLLTGFTWDWVTKCNGTDGWCGVDSFIRSFVLFPAFGLISLSSWMIGQLDSFFHDVGERLDNLLTLCAMRMRMQILSPFFLSPFFFCFFLGDVLMAVAVMVSLFDGDFGRFCRFNHPTTIFSSRFRFVLPLLLLLLSFIVFFFFLLIFSTRTCCLGDTN